MMLWELTRSAMFCPMRCAYTVPSLRRMNVAGGRDSVVEQIVDAEVLRDRRALVRQDREGRLRIVRHPPRIGGAVGAHGHHLRALRADVLVGALQLHELRLADASEEATVEDEHDRFVLRRDLVEPHR